MYTLVEHFDNSLLQISIFFKYFYEMCRRNFPGFCVTWPYIYVKPKRIGLKFCDVTEDFLVWEIVKQNCWISVLKKGGRYSSLIIWSCLIFGSNVFLLMFYQEESSQKNRLIWEDPGLEVGLRMGVGDGGGRLTQAK